MATKTKKKNKIAHSQKMVAKQIQSEASKSLSLIWEYDFKLIIQVSAS